MRKSQSAVALSPSSRAATSLPVSPRTFRNAASRSALRDASACTSPAAATRIVPISGDLPVSEGSIPGHLCAGMAQGSAPAEDLLDAMMHVAAALRDADVPYLL